MKIGELARRSGLTAYTIRYYERIGLLPRAGRNASGHRDYDASILDWIKFVECMKTTGMPIRDILRYARLLAQGAGTEDERRALLETHRERVNASLAELRACRAVLDYKIALYSGAETESDADAAKRRRLLRAKTDRASARLA